MTRKEQIELIAHKMNIAVDLLFLHIFIWKYKKLGDVSNDYSLFFHMGIIPDYVEEFLNEVQNKSAP